MAKTKQQKVTALADLAERLKEAKSAVFANFQGLKVKESEELRARLREQNVYYVATKKTILKRALKDAGLEVDTKSFAGGVAAIFGSEDEVAPAQLTAEFGKTHEAIKFFGGVLEGKFIDAAKVAALAKLPGKKQLLGRLVGTLQAPVAGFVNVLAGNLRGLVTVLTVIKEQKA